KTAEEAVGVIVELLETHGQGGPCSHEHRRFTYDNSFLVADKATAFVIETAGSHWETEKVAAGCARSLSNGLTIPRFAEIHSDRLRTHVADSKIRQAQTMTAAGSARTPAAMMAALRSHGSSSTPHYSLLNGAMAAPCMHAGGLLANSQTTASWVSDLGSVPRHWVTGTAAPCTSVFKPVTVDAPLQHNPIPSAHFDESSVWWRHERLHRLAMVDIPAAVARFSAQRNSLETRWLENPPDTNEAFAVADRLESDWIKDLENAALPDLRPRWTRSYWAVQNRRAGMTLGQRFPWPQK
ncbi:MAG TPA: hypothetical protein VL068_12800, partial [Microthrixaceae bacterium]|nr:hypothetical protein [Microthrixaceae bacterium]